MFPDALLRGGTGDPETDQAFDLLFRVRYATCTLPMTPHADRPGGADDAPAERGDLVVLVDESGSMRGEPLYFAKGFAAALRFFAKKENRRVTIVSFAARAEDLVVVEDAAPPEAAVDWLQRALGGGTDYGPPLRYALDLVEKNAAATGGGTDVVLLSDGRFDPAPDLIARVEEARRQLGLRLWGVRFGPGDFGALARVCDPRLRARPMPEGFLIERASEDPRA